MDMARIREVWAPNLDAEMRNIRDVIEKYPYIAMVLVSPSFHLVLSAYAKSRTRNSLELWHARLEHSRHPQIITIKRCGVMSTC